MILHFVLTDNNIVYFYVTREKSMIRKSLCYFFIVLIFTHSLFSKEIKSIFDNQKGKYSGSISGALFLKRGDINNKEKLFTILDFQGSKAELDVVHEEDEMYDSHYEHFQGYTTSGKSHIVYSTYANADQLQIHIGGIIYQITTIDGGCFKKIDGIHSVYYKENNSEYLILKFRKEIELHNYQQLLRQNYQKYVKSNNSDKNRKSDVQFLKILPDSVLVFLIKSN